MVCVVAFFAHATRVFRRSVPLCHCGFYMDPR